jgi:hypothetical protein
MTARLDPGCAVSTLDTYLDTLRAGIGCHGLALQTARRARIHARWRGNGGVAYGD